MNVLLKFEQKIINTITMQTIKEKTLYGRKLNANRIKMYTMIGKVLVGMTILINENILNK